MPQLNRFKAAIAAGHPQIGIWSTLSSPVVAEILGGAGYDWILFDSEHSPVEVAGLMPLLQAAAAGGASHAVRPAWNDKVLVKKVLDLGAQTVLLPFVQTPEEAAAAVAACRYPPHGIRGVAGATRASGYGRTTGYHAGADAEICVLVQVETGEAMTRLGDIAAVEGVDGVFIGPSDLSASMGHLANPAHPDVQAAIRQAAVTIADAGKAPGILATTAADARRYLDWGYLFVAVGVDAGLLVRACDGLLAEMMRQ